MVSMRDFIRNNRQEIDHIIKGQIKNTSFRIDDRERELWIQNDEGLYNWWRRSRR